ncbi:enoyl-CoA hydratase-related protein [Lacrimispora sp.]|uniref:enoyl-CoA hydratase-related protein n=1 Tax=Lacrimispora sp. TaxID=2719234 RepID=UPI00289946C1|nr:enoyl-CoA hydratase-related protein [Lacrimispora sp.]
MKNIKYRQDGYIGILTFSRPDALNALNSEVLAELSELLSKLEGSDIRCLIVTGEGEKSFIAGADIAEMEPLREKAARQFGLSGNQALNQLESLSVPVIAAVNGYALGGGCEVALACDIRIASANAVFGFPEVTLGIVPGFGGIQRMARTVGLAKAKELVFSACRIKAEEALQIGLVNSIAEPSELIDASLKLAGQIAANAPFSVQASKIIANQSAKIFDTRGLAVDLFGECFETMDQSNGMSAFLERRKPEAFTGERKETAEK